MYIELVELFRCVRRHDESWLVASIDEVRERSIIRGILGCPVCGAQYPISDGVADFSGAHPGGPDGNPVISESESEIAVRAGGLLGLGEAEGVIILGGSWAAGAAALSAMTGARVIAANPSAGIQRAAPVAIVRVGDAFPLGAGSCAGVALDESFTRGALSSALRVVRPGGRLAGPMSVERPTGLSLLASDAQWWVAEKAPDVTPLRRGNR